MSSRRSKIEIINDMLSSIQAKGGKIKPTHLMYKANLSHKLMNSYLDDLIKKEMVKEVKQERYAYLILTDKGLDFINQFRKMREFQDTFGL